MIRHMVVAASFSLLAPTLTLGAQMSGYDGEQHLVRVGFGGGVIVPRTGASTTTLERGAAGQGFVLLQLPGGLPALRFNVGYSKMKFDKSSLGLAGANIGQDADRTMLDGVVGLRFELPTGPVRPYILAGAGAFNIKDAVADSSYSLTKLGVDAGGGIAIKLGRLSMFAETKIQNAYTKQQGFIKTKSIQSFPVTFGLIF